MIFKASFAKDLWKINDRQLKKKVGELVAKIERSNSLHELDQIKKLIGAENYYRIKLGDFRVGLIMDGETVILVRFLHRKDIYRYFP